MVKERNPTENIKYAKGYKYQLRCQAVFYTHITGQTVKAELVELKPDGRLIIDKYFAWDGCSGPTLDDRTNMRAGLCHDALYYLMRTGKLGIKFRPAADDMLYHLMIQDGAWKIRATYYRWAFKKFTKPFAEPKNHRKILTAP
jgi:hypothetical protein